MRFAVDAEQKRISIAYSKPNETYFCPFCGAEMIQRKGKIRKWHFAHKGTQCLESIRYEAAEDIAEEIETVEEKKDDKTGTIPELWNRSQAIVMIVQNADTMRKFRIHDDPNLTVQKYKRCYGYMSDKNGKFIKGYKTVEIFGWDKPTWTLLWFKTAEDKRIKERIEAIMRI